MKAYKIFRDKKTENYVLLYFLFSVISYFLSMFWPDEGTVDRLEQMGRESFATNLLVFQLALSIIILLVILPKLVTYRITSYNVCYTKLLRTFSALNNRQKYSNSSYAMQERP